MLFCIAECYDRDINLQLMKHMANHLAVVSMEVEYLTPVQCTDIRQWKKAQPPFDCSVFFSSDRGTMIVTTLWSEDVEEIFSIYHSQSPRIPKGAENVISTGALYLSSGGGSGEKWVHSADWLPPWMTLSSLEILK